MNLSDYLPTRKVTAFAFGGSLVMVALWLLVDVFVVLPEWPPVQIGMALSLVVGAIVAWIVPEGAWRRLDAADARLHALADDDPERGSLTLAELVWVCVAAVGTAAVVVASTYLDGLALRLFAIWGALSIYLCAVLVLVLWFEHRRDGSAK